MKKKKVILSFILVILIMGIFFVRQSNSWGRFILICLAAFNPEKYAIPVSFSYVYGTSIFPQDFNKSLEYYKKLSIKQKIPMYSLQPLSALHPEAYDIRKKIHDHNGDFSYEMFKLEDDMIRFLKPYSNGISQIINTKLHSKEQIHNKSLPMLNGRGSASISGCYLDIINEIPLLLHLLPPNKQTIVIDVGSGWGVCAKDLALLGYKVYSIDLEPEHLEFQKKNFCTMPMNDTFIYQSGQLHEISDLKICHAKKLIFELITQ